MSCCGGKRAQLARDERLTIRREAPVAERPADEKPPPRIFERIGSGAVTIRGAVTGALYRFTDQGERLEVAYEDSFAMMAECGIRLVRRPTIDP